MKGSIDLATSPRGETTYGEIGAEDAHCRGANVHYGVIGRFVRMITASVWLSCKFDCSGELSRCRQRGVLQAGCPPRV